LGNQAGGTIQNRSRKVGRPKDVKTGAIIPGEFVPIFTFQPLKDLLRHGSRTNAIGLRVRCQRPSSFGDHPGDLAAAPGTLSVNGILYQSGGNEFFDIAINVVFNRYIG